MPVDPGTAIAAVEMATKVSERGIKGWNWLQRRLWGTVEITEPTHKSIWTREWLAVKGTHDGHAKGHYWLMTADGSKYWPQGEINFKHDGTWAADLNIGLRPGPRTSIIVVVRVDDVVDALLHDIKRCNKFSQDIVKSHKLRDELSRQCWSPFDLKQAKGRSFSIVTHRTVQVPEGPVK
jgi:hypothetical protein